MFDAPLSNLNDARFQYGRRSLCVRYWWRLDVNPFCPQHGPVQAYSCVRILRLAKRANRELVTVKGQLGILLICGPPRLELARFDEEFL